MEPRTSSSTAPRKLPVVRDEARINERCSLRRNVAVQPYGRCSVCSLELKQCHAWQSSALSFALVVAILIPLLAVDGWVVRLAVATALGLLLVQGMLNHARTDELIFGAHELDASTRRLRDVNADLERAREGLEREVQARTAKLRDANAALGRANLELADLAARREQWVLEVSHDLRTPLTSIKGAAQNLLDGIAGTLGPGQREYVTIVREHADRLIGSIGSLIEAARQSGPDLKIDERTIDVGELAAEIARGLGPIAADRGITLEVDVRPAEVRADPAHLRAILENLVGNALKYTDVGGRVRVEVAPIGDGVRLRVRDDGVGIAPDALERIFERFQRARDDRPGAGLGLAIARDLVRLHRGDIVVRSELGRGSEFDVVLPRCAA